MSSADALTTGLFALPTLAWAVVTRQLWIHRRVRPEPSPLYGPAAVAAGLITLHGALHVVEVFLPVGIGGGTAFAALRDATLLGVTAVGRHTPARHAAARVATRAALARDELRSPGGLRSPGARADHPAGGFHRLAAHRVRVAVARDRDHGRVVPAAGDSHGQAGGVGAGARG